MKFCLLEKGSSSSKENNIFEFSKNNKNNIMKILAINIDSVL